MGESLLIQALSWNANGLKQKFGNFLAFLQLVNYPKIVSIQETHSTLDLSILWASQLNNYFCYFSHGTSASKGTAIFIHRSLPFNILQEIHDTQGRYVILKGFLCNMQVTIGTIYAPSDSARNREIFFDELIGLNLGNIHYLFGDFNSVLDATMDRPNGSFGGDRELINFCNDTFSIEAWRFINPTKIEYSYARHIENGPFSRIDFCLVSSEASKTIVDANYMGFLGLSDHQFLMVDIKGGIPVVGFDFKKVKPGVVRNEKFVIGLKKVWGKVEEDFSNQVIEKIDNGNFKGNLEEAFLEVSGECDFSKPILLDNCKIEGPWWDRFKFSAFQLGRRVQKENKIEKIGKYREKMQEFLFSSGPRKKVLEGELASLIKNINKEEFFKAKVEQRKNFEKSSGAFFRMIKENQKNAYLDHVNMEGGGVVSGLDNMMDHFVDKFSRLYEAKDFDFEKFKGFDKYVPKIDSSVQQIDGEIVVEEVKKVVFRISPDKCTGWDGLPVELYKENFTLLGPYLVKLFNNICAFEGTFPESWDMSILKLIPKDSNLEKFRGLHMIDFDCKILAGVWANRMAEVVPDLINKFQTGGVRGRCIQSSTLLIHLLIQYQKQQSKGGYILSLDNATAFVLLNREYLFHVLRKYGFSEKTVSVIEKFYKNNVCKIILNGFLSKTFKISSGVRQGCPLSAMLYVLAVEPLSVAIFQAHQMEGFVLPNNSEVKLVQHVDDLNLFAKNKNSILVALNLVRQFGEISGSILNSQKSFIIEIGQSNESYFIEGIPVLKNMYKMKLIGGRETKVFVGEFKKILGIYFCASVKQYVYKNWAEVFLKCGKVMDMWEKERLSVIGRVLILNVKIIPKIFYLLQSIEPMKYWQDRLTTRFREFIGGGSNGIPLSILEWGRDRGGLGLYSIMLKARSLRFEYVKDFLCRKNFRELSPINSIINYYLEIPTIGRYRPNMVRSDQMCYGGEKRIIDRGDMRKNFFSCFLEDIGWYTNYENKYPEVESWSQKEYYEKIVAYSADFIREQNRDLVKIDVLRLSCENERKIWKNVYLNSLSTKIQSFNLKLVHGALPTLQVIGGKSRDFPNKWCVYCRNVLNINVIESDTHILLECVVAKNVWYCINDRLRSAFLTNITVNKSSMFYKIGLGNPQSHLVSEVNWALWVNRCSNVYEGNLNSHRCVLKTLFYRLKLDSKVDKVLLSVKVYNKRWLGLNEAIEAIDV